MRSKSGSSRTLSAGSQKMMHVDGTVSTEILSITDVDIAPGHLSNSTTPSEPNARDTVQDEAPNGADRQLTKEQCQSIKEVYNHALFPKGITHLPYCSVCGANAPDHLHSGPKGHFNQTMGRFRKHVEIYHPNECAGDPDRCIAYYVVPYDDAILMSEYKEPKEPVVITSREIGRWNNEEMGSMPYGKFLEDRKLSPHIIH